jgi:hypothetical protein
MALSHKKKMLIPLTKGKQAVIDRQDFNLISGHKWNFKDRYAETKIGGKTVLMHRLIMGVGGVVGKQVVVDHINHDGLDNRRSNLRLVTVMGNSLNRRMNSNSPTGVRGVTVTPYGFVVIVKVGGRNYNFGTYETLEEAKLVSEGVYAERRKWHGFE